MNTNNQNVNQNVVPSNSPRKVILSNGILFRFGFQQIQGSDFSKVGEIIYNYLPNVNDLMFVQQSYCREHNIDEPFIPEDYGY